MSENSYDLTALLSPWGLAAMTILALVLVLLIVLNNDLLPLKRREREPEEKD